MQEVNVFWDYTFINMLLIRSDICKFESGVLPFESRDPKSLTFEVYENYFGRPLQSLGPVHVGDKIKIYCLEKGDIFCPDIFFNNNSFRFKIYSGCGHKGSVSDWKLPEKHYL